MNTRAQERRQVERWFLRQGLPHLIDGYRASTDVYTRAAPFLLLVFLFNIVGAYSDRFSGWGQAVVAGLSFAIILAGGVGVNLVRGRGPLQLPDQIGVLELAAFTLVPAIPPLLFGLHPVEVAAGIVVVNLVLLVVVYIVVGYGLVPTSVWAFRQTIRHLSQLLTLMGRALPFVLVFSAFLFLNAELWQVAADFTPLSFWVTVGLLAAVAAAFVALRIPREIDGIARFESWSEVARLADRPGCPLAVTDTSGSRGDCDPPLSRRDRLNVILVVMISLGLQIFLVAGLIGVFYTVFGLFAVREETIATWTTLDELTNSDVVARWRLFGTELAVTVVLLRVVGFLMAFSALQFSVSAVTDAAYRQEFFDEVTDEVRHALAVRSIYLERRVDEAGPD